MTGYLVAYGSVLLVLTAVDIVWIQLVMREMFIAALGPLLRTEPRYGAAVAFYLIYPAGIILLAADTKRHVRPFLTAAWKGALLGLCSYGTYELTNRATLAIWPLQIVVVDMAWGITSTACAALIGQVVLGRYARAAEIARR